VLSYIVLHGFTSREDIAKKCSEGLDVGERSVSRYLRNLTDRTPEEGGERLRADRSCQRSYLAKIRCELHSDGAFSLLVSIRVLIRKSSSRNWEIAGTGERESGDPLALRRLHRQGI
jgi:hypothetical protein